MSNYGRLLEELKQKDQEAAILQQRIQDRITALSESFEEDVAGMDIDGLKALLQIKQDELEQLEGKAQSIETKVRRSLAKLGEDIEAVKEIL